MQAQSVSGLVLTRRARPLLRTAAVRRGGHLPSDRPAMQRAACGTPHALVPADAAISPTWWAAFRSATVSQPS